MSQISFQDFLSRLHVLVLKGDYVFISSPSENEIVFCIGDTSSFRRYIRIIDGLNYFQLSILVRDNVTFRSYVAKNQGLPYETLKSIWQAVYHQVTVNEFPAEMQRVADLLLPPK